MTFAEELARVLPADIPHRERLIEKSAKHLELIAVVNEYMNLTRIASAQEAAIKHVLDCVTPWKFFEGAGRILDAGTGAGFPGIPLAIVLPETRFVLTESIQKKARFVESAVDELDLPNVEVAADRAEVIAMQLRPAVITARAVAPLDRIVELLAKPLQQGSRLLLYKGPDVSAEIASLNGRRVSATILSSYGLADGLGTRTLVSVQSALPRKRE